MDAVTNNSSQGNPRCRFAVVMVALLAFQLWQAELTAQVLRVRSSDGDQTLPHALDDAPQSFTPVRWDIQNQQFRNGCVVLWTVAAFEHESEGGTTADCEISARIVRSTGRARWSVTTGSDATSVSTGKKSAAVSIASDARGNAEAEILIRFTTNDVSSLTAGNYTTTLTGTISGP